MGFRVQGLGLWVLGLTVGGYGSRVIGFKLKDRSLHFVGNRQSASTVGRGWVGVASDLFQRDARAGAGAEFWIGQTRARARGRTQIAFCDRNVVCKVELKGEPTLPHNLSCLLLKRSKFLSALSQTTATPSHLPRSCPPCTPARWTVTHDRSGGA